MSKKKYMAHYRELCEDYFRDCTIEGGIAKKYRIKEAEYVLENIFGMPHEDLRALWDTLYWAHYGKKGATA